MIFNRELRERLVQPRLQKSIRICFVRGPFARIVGRGGSLLLNRTETNRTPLFKYTYACAVGMMPIAVPIFTVPTDPPGAYPEPLLQPMQRCWAQEPAARPSFA